MEEEEQQQQRLDRFWQTWYSCLHQSLLKDVCARSSKGVSRKKCLSVSRDTVHLMLRDTLAVVCGPRSAALLSYVHGHGQHTIHALREIIGMMERDVMVERKGEVSIMVSDGCLVLLKVDRLRDRAIPRGISFLHENQHNERWRDGGSMKPSWMTEREQQALDESFHRIVGCLASSLPPNMDGMDMEQCLLEKGITLGIDGAPCPPTLYGWMLGYPVTYHVVSEDHALQVSRCLSSDTLILYTLQTRPRAMEEIDDTLMSFSIPQSLHGEMTDDMVETWTETICRDCDQELWSSPLVTKTSKRVGSVVL